MQILDHAYTDPGPDPSHYVEHVQTPHISVGTFSIPAGGIDDQEPHREDDVYVVTTGHGHFVTHEGAAPVGPGSVIFVPAGEDHRFADITEDLTVAVVFAPPYTGR